MTLPQLYTDVTLRSYDSIRYSPEDGRVEGSGMGSPFVMGLNGLVLRDVSGYVRQLRFVGEWREHDLEEFSKKGRVPDSSMMLNTLVRVAIGRSANLRDLWYAQVQRLPGKTFQLTRHQLGAQYEDAADRMARSGIF